VTITWWRSWLAGCAGPWRRRHAGRSGGGGADLIWVLRVTAMASLVVVLARCGDAGGLALAIDGAHVHVGQAGMLRSSSSGSVVVRLSCSGTTVYLSRFGGTISIPPWRPGGTPAVVVDVLLLVDKLPSAVVFSIHSTTHLRFAGVRSPA
jgi:hypothetical protein